MRKIIYLLPLAAFFICCPVAQGKTIYVAKGEHITLPKGTWGSQNKKIAKIKGKKELIGKKKGKTVVKNNKKEITVVVKKAKEIRLAVGDYKEIGKGKWNSTQIAAVKNKKLIAKKAGKTYIKNKKGKCHKVIKVMRAKTPGLARGMKPYFLLYKSIDTIYNICITEM